jgi:hypothetical protein
MTSLCGGRAKHGSGVEILGVGSLAPSGGPERRGPEKRSGKEVRKYSVCWRSGTTRAGGSSSKPLGRLIGRTENRGT